MNVALVLLVCFAFLSQSFEIMSLRNRVSRMEKDMRETRGLILEGAKQQSGQAKQLVSLIDQRSQDAENVDRIARAMYGISSDVKRMRNLIKELFGR